MNKPKFDPNKPFEVVGAPQGKPKFDPNAPFEPVTDNTTSPDDEGLLSDLADTGRGIAQGATLGFADELYGAGAAGVDKLKGALKGEDTEDFIKLYRKYQKEAEAADEKSRERSPWLHGLGELTGGVAGGLATGGAGLELAAGKMGLRAAAKAGVGTLAKEVGKRGAEAAALGAVAGVGTSKGDLDSTEGVKTIGRDALVNAGVGGAIGTGLSTIGSQIPTEKISEYLRKLGVNQPAIGKYVLGPMKLGAEGINGTDKAAVEASGNNIATHNFAGDVAKKYNEFEGKVGQNLGNILQNSEENIPLDDIHAAMTQLRERATAAGMKPEEIEKYEKMLRGMHYEEPPSVIKNKAQEINTSTNAVHPDTGEMEPAGNSVIKKLKGEGEVDALDQVPNLEPGEVRSSTKSNFGPDGEPVSEVNQTVQGFNQNNPGTLRDSLPAAQFHKNMRAFGDQLGDLYSNPSEVPNFVFDTFKPLGEAMNNRLKSQVPEYAQEAQRYFDTRRLFPETLLSKGKDPALSGVRYGNFKDPRAKLNSGLIDTLDKLGNETSPTDTANQTLYRFKDSLKQLQEKENLYKANNPGATSIFDELGMTPDELTRKMEDISQRNASIKAMNEKGHPMMGGLVGGALGGHFLGPAGAIMGAAGGVLKSHPAQLAITANKLGYYGAKAASGAKRLYALGDDALKGVAGQLSAKGFTAAGNALNKALAEKNTFMKNAAIFSILQNPNARVLFDEDNNNLGQ